MTELLINSKRFVISRQCDGKVELVSATGEILKLDEKQLLGIPHRVIEKSVVPDVIPFRSRPRSFLSDLRAKRDIDLALRQKAKRRVNLSTPNLEGARKIRSVQKPSQKSLAAAAALSLPFDIAAILKKGSKHGK